MFKNHLLLLAMLTLVWSCNPSEDELFDAGITALESEDFTKSIEYFDRVTEENADNSAAWNAKGVAYFELGNWDESIDAFTRSIALDSANYKPYFNRGNAYMEKEEFRNALIDYNRANGLDLQQADIYYNRGLALLGMENYEDALVDFETSIQAQPGQPQVYFNKAKALLGNNDPITAISVLKQTLELDNRNAAAYYLLGVTQMSAMGEKEEGCTHLNEALRLGYTQANEWIQEFCKEQ